MENISSNFQGHAEVGDTFVPCGTSGRSGRDWKVAVTQQRTFGMLRKLKSSVSRACRIQIWNKNSLIRITCDKLKNKDLMSQLSN